MKPQARLITEKLGSSEPQEPELSDESKFNALCWAFGWSFATVGGLMIHPGLGLIVGGGLAFMSALAHMLAKELRHDH